MRGNYLNITFAVFGFPVHLDVSLTGWTLQILATIGPELKADSPARLNLPSTARVMIPRDVMEFVETYDQVKNS